MYLIQHRYNRHEFLQPSDEAPVWGEKFDAQQFARRVDAEAVVSRFGIFRITQITRE